MKPGVVQLLELLRPEGLGAAGLAGALTAAGFGFAIGLGIGAGALAAGFGAGVSV
jgi:tetrahydromethanopterin S-methyltransferase subunit B